MAIQPNIDILDIILNDHRVIRNLLLELKAVEKDRAEKEKIYFELQRVLTAHAKAEELSLYVAMESRVDFRGLGLQGEVEHAVAEKLMEEIRKTSDDSEWAAKIKVWQTLVEQHLDVEEKDILPKFREVTDPRERQDIAKAYLDLKKILL